MQKNLYYRAVLKRENAHKNLLYGLLLSICTFPRLLLEVFTRKDFGERYFRLSAVVWVTLIMGLFPIYWRDMAIFFTHRRSGGSDFFASYVTWYLFLIAFLYFSYIRWQEVRRNPSVYDFARFSLCSGTINPAFYKVQLFKKTPSKRVVEILYEPGVFFFGGLVLAIAGQSLGGLLVFCSLLYSLSYLAAYNHGDNFVMDKIDEMILNEEMEEAFVNDAGPEATRGAQFYTRKPNGEANRRRVADTFIVKEEEEITLAI